jgi:hypothetical protein
VALGFETGFPESSGKGRKKLEICFSFALPQLFSGFALARAKAQKKRGHPPLVKAMQKEKVFKCY